VRQRGTDNLCEYLQGEQEQCDIEKIREQTSDRILRSQAYNKEYSDSKRKKVHKYSVGDLVSIKNFDTTGASLIPTCKETYKVDTR